MQRSKCFCRAGLAGLAFFALALPASAGTLPADALPLPNRVAGADLVVTGKIMGYEDKTVMVAPFPGAKNLVEYKVAVIAVSEALVAPKGTKKVRLGFVPAPPGVVINPPPFQPAVGQEGCFFLSKHGTADFQVAPGQLQFVDKNNANFDKDLALIKRCTWLLEDPNAGLTSKNGEDRFLTAAMLVVQYTKRQSASDKKEPIDAEQSKLILRALAAADWTPPKDFTQLSPLMVLQRLPLTDKDGWMPPAKDPKAYAAYAQQWVREHADTYRIQKFVPDKSK